MSRQQKVQEQKLWTCGFNFAKALADIYQLCVSQYERALPAPARYASRSRSSSRAPCARSRSR